MGQHPCTNRATGRRVCPQAKTQFVFPQQHASPRAFVCNGEAYGEFELLQVTGVVRLEAKPELVAFVDNKPKVGARRDVG